MIQFRRPTRSDSYGVVDCKHTAGVCVVESEAENSKLRIPECVHMAYIGKEWTHV